MKQGRRIILIILSILLLSISYNLATAPTLHAQIYPMFPFFHSPWSSGLPLLPAPITLSAAPCIPFCTFPSALSLARSAAVVTTIAAPLAVTATAPVATILPPATTPAGYTVTSLIPVLAPAPLLPITTTTYGALTTLVLSGTSAYTLLSLILL
jgi:hypothetical protein